MLSIKIAGVEQALRQLEKYSKSIDNRMKTLVERIMQEGYEAAVSGFAPALYAGHNDVKVLSPRWEGDRMILEATGTAVAFIEFGTGTSPRFEPYPDETAYARLGLAPRGEYDKKHGKNPPWYYRGDPGNFGKPKRRRDGSDDPEWIVTWGNPPARAMFNAGLKVSDRDRIAAIAREVFS